MSDWVARLPEWARPRDEVKRGLGSLRLAETTILILFGVLLAVATVNDVAQQTKVNHRLIADLHTWRVVTGHDYHNLILSQDLKGHTTRDTVCGNVSPGGPKERTQVCVTLVGAQVNGERKITGGFYLPPMSENIPSKRYACFGAAVSAQACGLRRAPVGSPPAPPVRLGLP
ncbi:MAG TPA: hypothetical protein VGI26_03065 [Solirubrobacteraceae bacterium]|jgi:hypothetical protein